MDEMRQRLRACCLSPARSATPILKFGPVVPSDEEQGQDVAARGLRPHHRLSVASTASRLCMNEILIMSTTIAGLIQTPHNTV